jgi:NAD(P)-dependent dehydrogenase (short-subunit alcohol dehydrogenase family)
VTTAVAWAEQPLADIREAVGSAPLLQGRTVVLTGAAGGIGRSLAAVLVAAGAQLAAADRADAALAEVDAALVAGADASDRVEFGSFLARVERELGPVDGLVNCAGFWSARSFDAVDEDAWAQMLAANLTTAFVACQAVLPAMMARGQGAIVNFASTAGEYGSISPAAHYAAAKGGVIALTKSLAREASPFGVRVNALSPGPTDTRALGAATPEQKRDVGARTLLGRLGHPDEIAGACVFLLSPLAGFITGHVLGVNGGSLL